MKPFRFSLQSLHQLREQKERVAQKRYVDALQAARDAAVRLDRAQFQLAAAWTSLCQEVSLGGTVATLLQTRGWCGELERQCDALAAASGSTQKLAQEAGRELARAAREREALDRLRDKCRHAFERDLRRTEQKALDEMAVRRPAGLEPRASTETFNAQSR